MSPTVATAADLATRLGGTVVGRGDLPVRGVNSLDEAAESELTFISDDAHARRWRASAARVALVSRTLSVPDHDPAARALIEVERADLAMVSVLEIFAPPTPLPPVGIHRSAVVEPDAVIDPSARIGALCYVGSGARIGAGCTLHVGAVVCDRTTLGEGCTLHPRAVVRERCVLGRAVTLHTGAIVGSDGFGYHPAPGGGGLVRVPHLGNVELADGVELGALTCVDRAKFGSTRIGQGSKLDNLCQIGHNVQIGRSCVLSGLTGIAGSTTVGDGVRIGGHTGIRDHVNIGSGAQLSAKSAVMGDIPAGEIWGGAPAQEIRQMFRQVAALRTLAPIAGALKRLVGKGAAE